MTEQGKCPLLSLAHVAILGDSQFKYLHEHFPSGPQAPYIRHLSGAQTTDILTLVCDAPTDTTHFIINVGTNNLHSQNAAETIESLNDVILSIQTARPNTHITVTTVAPRLQNKHRPLIHQTTALMRHTEERNKLNTLILNLPHFHKNVDAIHHTEIHNSPHEHLAWDGLHLNHRGVAAVAQRIKHLIKGQHNVTYQPTQGPSTIPVSVTAPRTRATLAHSATSHTQTTEQKTNSPPKTHSSASQTEATYTTAEASTQTTPNARSTAEAYTQTTSNMRPTAEPSTQITCPPPHYHQEPDTTETDETKSATEVVTQTPTLIPPHTDTQAATVVESNEPEVQTAPKPERADTRRSTRTKTNK